MITNVQVVIEDQDFVVRITFDEVPTVPVGTFAGYGINPGWALHDGPTIATSDKVLYLGWGTGTPNPAYTEPAAGITGMVLQLVPSLFPEESLYAHYYPGGPWTPAGDITNTAFSGWSITALAATDTIPAFSYEQRGWHYGYYGNPNVRNVNSTDFITSNTVANGNYLLGFDNPHSPATPVVTTFTGPRTRTLSGGAAVTIPDELRSICLDSDFSTGLAVFNQTLFVSPPSFTLPAGITFSNIQATDSDSDMFSFDVSGATGNFQVSYTDLRDSDSEVFTVTTQNEGLAIENWAITVNDRNSHDFTLHFWFNQDMTEQSFGSVGQTTSRFVFHNQPTLAASTRTFWPFDNTPGNYVRDGNYVHTTYGAGNYGHEYRSLLGDIAANTQGWYVTFLEPGFTGFPSYSYNHINNTLYPPTTDMDAIGDSDLNYPIANPGPGAVVNSQIQDCGGMLIRTAQQTSRLLSATFTSGSRDEVQLRFSSPPGFPVAAINTQVTNLAGATLSGATLSSDGFTYTAAVAPAQDTEIEFTHNSVTVTSHTSTIPENAVVHVDLRPQFNWIQIANLTGLVGSTFNTSLITLVGTEEEVNLTHDSDFTVDAAGTVRLNLTDSDRNLILFANINAFDPSNTITYNAGIPRDIGAFSDLTDEPIRVTNAEFDGVYMNGRGRAIITYDQPIDAPLVNNTNIMRFASEAQHITWDTPDSEVNASATSFQLTVNDTTYANALFSSIQTFFNTTVAADLARYDSEYNWAFQINSITTQLNNNFLRLGIYSGTTVSRVGNTLTFNNLRDSGQNSGIAVFPLRYADPDFLGYETGLFAFRADFSATDNPPFTAPNNYTSSNTLELTDSTIERGGFAGTQLIIALGPDDSRTLSESSLLFTDSDDSAFVLYSVASQNGQRRATNRVISAWDEYVPLLASRDSDSRIVSAELSTCNTMLNMRFTLPTGNIDSDDFYYVGLLEDGITYVRNSDTEITATIPRANAEATSGNFTVAFLDSDSEVTTTGWESTTSTLAGFDFDGSRIVLSYTGQPAAQVLANGTRITRPSTGASVTLGALSSGSLLNDSEFVITPSSQDISALRDSELFTVDTDYTIEIDSERVLNVCGNSISGAVNASSISGLIDTTRPTVTRWSFDVGEDMTGVIRISLSELASTTEPIDISRLTLRSPGRLDTPLRMGDGSVTVEDSEIIIDLNAVGRMHIAGRGILTTPGVQVSLVIPQDTLFDTSGLGNVGIALVGAIYSVYDVVSPHLSSFSFQANTGNGLLSLTFSEHLDSDFLFDVNAVTVSDNLGNSLRLPTNAAGASIDDNVVNLLITPVGRTTLINNNIFQRVAARYTVSVDTDTVRDASRNRNALTSITDSELASNLYFDISAATLLHDSENGYNRVIEFDLDTDAGYAPALNALADFGLSGTNINGFLFAARIERVNNHLVRLISTGNVLDDAAFAWRGHSGSFSGYTVLLDDSDSDWVVSTDSESWIMKFNTPTSNPLVITRNRRDILINNRTLEAQATEVFPVNDTGTRIDSEFSAYWGATFRGNDFIVNNSGFTTYRWFQLPTFNIPLPVPTFAFNALQGAWATPYNQNAQYTALIDAGRNNLPANRALYRQFSQAVITVSSNVLNSRGTFPSTDTDYPFWPRAIENIYIDSDSIADINGDSDSEILVNIAYDNTMQVLMLNDSRASLIGKTISFRDGTGNRKDVVVGRAYEKVFNGSPPILNVFNNGFATAENGNAEYFTMPDTDQRDCLQAFLEVARQQQHDITIRMPLNGSRSSWVRVTGDQARRYNNFSTRLIGISETTGPNVSRVDSFDWSTTYFNTMLMQQTVTVNENRPSIQQSLGDAWGTSYGLILGAIINGVRYTYGDTVTINRGDSDYTFTFGHMDSSTCPQLPPPNPAITEGTVRGLGCGTAVSVGGFFLPTDSDGFTVSNNTITRDFLASDGTGGIVVVDSEVSVGDVITGATLTGRDSETIDFVNRRGEQLEITQIINADSDGATLVMKNVSQAEALVKLFDEITADTVGRGIGLYGISITDITSSLTNFATGGTTLLQFYDEIDRDPDRDDSDSAFNYVRVGRNVVINIRNINTVYADPSKQGQRVAERYSGWTIPSAAGIARNIRSGQPVNGDRGVITRIAWFKTNSVVLTELPDSRHRVRNGFIFGLSAADSVDGIAHNISRQASFLINQELTKDLPMNPETFFDNGDRFRYNWVDSEDLWCEVSDRVNFTATVQERVNRNDTLLLQFDSDISTLQFQELAFSTGDCDDEDSRVLTHINQSDIRDSDNNLWVVDLTLPNTSNSMWRVTGVTFDSDGNTSDGAGRWNGGIVRFTFADSDCGPRFRNFIDPFIKGNTVIETNDGHGLRFVYDSDSDVRLPTFSNRNEDFVYERFGSGVTATFDSDGNNLWHALTGFIPNPEHEYRWDILGVSGPSAPLLTTPRYSVFIPGSAITVDSGGDWTWNGSDARAVPGTEEVPDSTETGIRNDRTQMRALASPQVVDIEFPSSATHYLTVNPGTPSSDSDSDLISSVNFGSSVFTVGNRRSGENFGDCVEESLRLPSGNFNVCWSSHYDSVNGNTDQTVIPVETTGAESYTDVRLLSAVALPGSYTQITLTFDGDPNDFNRFVYTDLEFSAGRLWPEVYQVNERVWKVAVQDLFESNLTVSYRDGAAINVTGVSNVLSKPAPLTDNHWQLIDARTGGAPNDARFNVSRQQIVFKDQAGTYGLYAFMMEQKSFHSVRFDDSDTTAYTAAKGLVYRNPLFIPANNGNFSFGSGVNPTAEIPFATDNFTRASNFATGTYGYRWYPLAISSEQHNYGARTAVWISGDIPGVNRFSYYPVYDLADYPPFYEGYTGTGNAAIDRIGFNNFDGTNPFNSNYLIGYESAEGRVSNNSGDLYISNGLRFGQRMAVPAVTLSSCNTTLKFTFDSDSMPIGILPQHIWWRTGVNLNLVPSYQNEILFTRVPNEYAFQAIVDPAMFTTRTPTLSYLGLDVTVTGTGDNPVVAANTRPTGYLEGFGVQIFDATWSNSNRQLTVRGSGFEVEASNWSVGPDSENVYVNAAAQLISSGEWSDRDAPNSNITNINYIGADASIASESATYANQVAAANSRTTIAANRFIYYDNNDNAFYYLDSDNLFNDGLQVPGNPEFNNVHGRFYLPLFTRNAWNTISDSLRNTYINSVRRYSLNGDSDSDYLLWDTYRPANRPGAWTRVNGSPQTATITFDEPVFRGTFDDSDDASTYPAIGWRSIGISSNNACDSETRQYVPVEVPKLPNIAIRRVGIGESFLDSPGQEPNDISAGGGGRSNVIRITFVSRETAAEVAEVVNSAGGFDSDSDWSIDLGNGFVVTPEPGTNVRRTEIRAVGSEVLIQVYDSDTGTESGSARLVIPANAAIPGYVDSDGVDNRSHTTFLANLNLGRNRPNLFRDNNGVGYDSDGVIRILYDEGTPVPPPTEISSVVLSDCGTQIIVEGVNLPTTPDDWEIIGNRTSGAAAGSSCCPGRGVSISTSDVAWVTASVSGTAGRIPDPDDPNDHGEDGRVTINLAEGGGAIVAQWQGTTTTFTDFRCGAYRTNTLFNGGGYNSFSVTAAAGTPLGTISHQFSPYGIFRANSCGCTGCVTTPYPVDSLMNVSGTMAGGSVTSSGNTYRETMVITFANTEQARQAMLWAFGNENTASTNTGAIRVRLISANFFVFAAGSFPVAVTRVGNAVNFRITTFTGTDISGGGWFERTGSGTLIGFGPAYGPNTLRNGVTLAVCSADRPFLQPVPFVAEINQDLNEVQVRFNSELAFVPSASGFAFSGTLASQISWSGSASDLIEVDSEQVYILRISGITPTMNIDSDLRTTYLHFDGYTDNIGPRYLSCDRLRRLQDVRWTPMNNGNFDSGVLALYYDSDVSYAAGDEFLLNNRLAASYVPRPEFVSSGLIGDRHVLTYHFGNNSFDTDDVVTLADCSPNVSRSMARGWTVTDLSITNGLTFATVEEANGFRNYVDSDTIRRIWVVSEDDANQGSTTTRALEFFVGESGALSLNTNTGVVDFANNFSTIGGSMMLPFNVGTNNLAIVAIETVDSDILRPGIVSNGLEFGESLELSSWTTGVNYATFDERTYFLELGSRNEVSFAFQPVYTPADQSHALAANVPLVDFYISDGTRALLLDDHMVKSVTAVTHTSDSMRVSLQLNSSIDLNGPSGFDYGGTGSAIPENQRFGNDNFTYITWRVNNEIFGGDSDMDQIDQSRFIDNIIDPDVPSQRVRELSVDVTDTRGNTFRPANWIAINSIPIPNWTSGLLNVNYVNTDSEVYFRFSANSVINSTVTGLISPLVDTDNFLEVDSERYYTNVNFDLRDMYLTDGVSQADSSFFGLIAGELISTPLVTPPNECYPGDGFLCTETAGETYIKGFTFDSDAYGDITMHLFSESDSQKDWFIDYNRNKSFGRRANPKMRFKAFTEANHGMELYGIAPSFTLIGWSEDFAKRSTNAHYIRERDSAVRNPPNARLLAEQIGGDSEDINAAAATSYEAIPYGGCNPGAPVSTLFGGTPCTDRSRYFAATPIPDPGILVAVEFHSDDSDRIEEITAVFSPGTNSSNIDSEYAFSGIVDTPSTDSDRVRNGVVYGIRTLDSDAMAIGTRNIFGADFVTIRYSIRNTGNTPFIPGGYLPRYAVDGSIMGLKGTGVSVPLTIHQNTPLPRPVFATYNGLNDTLTVNYSELINIQGGFEDQYGYAMTIDNNYRYDSVLNPVDLIQIRHPNAFNNFTATIAYTLPAADAAAIEAAGNEVITLGQFGVEFEGRAFHSGNDLNLVIDYDMNEVVVFWEGNRYPGNPQNDRFYYLNFLAGDWHRVGNPAVVDSEAYEFIGRGADFSVDTDYIVNSVPFSAWKIPFNRQLSRLHGLVPVLGMVTPGSSNIAYAGRSVSVAFDLNPDSDSDATMLFTDAHDGVTHGDRTHILGQSIPITRNQTVTFNGINSEWNEIWLDNDHMVNGYGTNFGNNDNLTYPGWHDIVGQLNGNLNSSTRVSDTRPDGFSGILSEFPNIRDDSDYRAAYRYELVTDSDFDTDVTVPWIRIVSDTSVDSETFYDAFRNHEVTTSATVQQVNSPEARNNDPGLINISFAEENPNTGNGARQVFLEPLFMNDLVKRVYTDPFNPDSDDVGPLEMASAYMARRPYRDDEYFLGSVTQGLAPADSEVTGAIDSDYEVDVSSIITPRANPIESVINVRTNTAVSYSVDASTGLLKIDSDAAMVGDTFRITSGEGRHRLLMETAPFTVEQSYLLDSENAVGDPVTRAQFTGKNGSYDSDVNPSPLGVNTGSVNYVRVTYIDGGGNTRSFNRTETVANTITRGTQPALGAAGTGPSRFSITSNGMSIVDGEPIAASSSHYEVATQIADYINREFSSMFVAAVDSDYQRRNIITVTRVAGPGQDSDFDITIDAGNNANLTVPDISVSSVVLNPGRPFGGSTDSDLSQIRVRVGDRYYPEQLADIPENTSSTDIAEIILNYFEQDDSRWDGTAFYGISRDNNVLTATLNYFGTGPDLAVEVEAGSSENLVVDVTETKRGESGWSTPRPFTQT